MNKFVSFAAAVISSACAQQSDSRYLKGSVCAERWAAMESEWENSCTNISDWSTSLAYRTCMGFLNECDIMPPQCRGLRRCATGTPKASMKNKCCSGSAARVEWPAATAFQQKPTPTPTPAPIVTLMQTQQDYRAAGSGQTTCTGGWKLLQGNNGSYYYGYTRSTQKWCCSDCKCTNWSDRELCTGMSNSTGAASLAGPGQTTCTGNWGQWPDDAKRNGITEQWCCTGCNCKNKYDAETCTGTSNSSALNTIQSSISTAPKPTQRTCTGNWGKGGDDAQHNGGTQQWCCTGCNCKDQSDAETCTGSSNSTASNTTQSFNSTIITETNRAGSGQTTCTGNWGRWGDDAQHNGGTQQWCCTGCNCKDQSDAETCTGTSNSTDSNTTQSSNSTASISTRSASWHTKWSGAKDYANSTDVTDMDYYLKSSNFTLRETPSLYECLKKESVYKWTLSCLNWNCKSHSRFYKQECRKFYQDKDTATYYQCKKDVVTFEQACKERSNELMNQKFPNTTAMIESGASLSSNTTAANTTTPTSGATKIFAGASMILASAFVF